MSKFGNFWKTLLAGGAGFAALAAVNATIRKNPLEPDDSVLGGTANYFNWKHGRIFYKEAGLKKIGLPVVFIHGVGAGQSSFQWRKNFDPLSETFRVYAIDLLGFGLSDKPAGAAYSTELYVELISDFLREVVQGPANIVASGLGASYSIRVADEHPELVNALILNSPVGYANPNARPGMTGAAFYGLLQSPVLGTSFYNVMASERSIRDYARRSLFYDYRRITNRLVSNLYASSHQPGAQHAMAAYISGYLNADISVPFSRLDQPTQLVWGKQDTLTPISQAYQLLDLNARTGLRIYDFCRAMPEQEYPEEYNDLIIQTFRARAAAR